MGKIDHKYTASNQQFQLYDENIISYSLDDHMYESFNYSFRKSEKNFKIKFFDLGILVWENQNDSIETLTLPNSEIVLLDQQLKNKYYIWYKNPTESGLGNIIGSANTAVTSLPNCKWVIRVTNARDSNLPPKIVSENSNFFPRMATESTYKNKKIWFHIIEIKK
ncbi:MAG: hypothetical protein IPP71_08205 [Bacteroidetes bacterium]|nr:hypothetical protein [Bacteroidota bacterium]